MVVPIRLATRIRFTGLAAGVVWVIGILIGLMIKQAQTYHISVNKFHIQPGAAGKYAGVYKKSNKPLTGPFLLTGKAGC